MRASADLAVSIAAALVMSVAIAAALLLLPVAGIYSHSAPDAWLTVPATAVILVARGVSLKDRLSYLAVALGIYFGIGIVLNVTGFVDFADSGRIAGTGVLPIMAMRAYRWFIMGYPIVMVMLFFGTKPYLLWSRDAE